MVRFHPAGLSLLENEKKHEHTVHSMNFQPSSTEFYDDQETMQGG